MHVSNNLHTNAYLEAARDLGLGFDVIDVDHAFAKIYSVDRSLFLNGRSVGCNDIVSSANATDQQAVLAFLKEKDIPVCEYRLFRSYQKFSTLYEWKKIIDYSQQRYPVTVRLFHKGAPEEVFSNIHSDTEMKMVLDFAQKARSNALSVESYFGGRHYFITMLDEKVLELTEYRLPAVKGNGVSSLLELIAMEQSNCLPSRYYPFVNGAMLGFFLEKARLSSMYVPVLNEEVLLADGYGGFRGGHKVWLNSEAMPKQNIALCCEARRASRLRFAKLHFITKDLTIPWTPSDIRFSEVNARPTPIVPKSPEANGEPSMAHRLLIHYFGLA